MTTKTRQLATVAAVCLMLAPTAALADVKLGALYGVTGPIASFIPPIADASNLAIDQVNAQGGILGGQTLSLVIGDTQCAPQSSIDAATTLVNVEGVVAIAGALCSGATMGAAGAVAIPQGVPMLSSASTSPQITGLDDNDYVFRVAPSDAYQGEVVAKYVMDSGITSVALTFVNNDYGVGLASAFRDAYTAMGGTITADQVHEQQKSSYRSELATLSSGGPQALVLFAYAADSGITMVRQSLENGFFDTFVGADSMKDNALIEAIGADNLQNMYVTSPTSLPDTDGSAVFTEAFTGAYDSDVSSLFVPQSYDAVFMLALAIEQAGSTDRAAVRDALRLIGDGEGESIGPGEWSKAVELIAAGTAIDYNGASGPHDFDAAGDVPGVIGEFKIQDNVWVETGILTK